MSLSDLNIINMSDSPVFTNKASVLSNEARYRMFIEMYKADPKMWNRSHHLFNMHSNLFIFYYTLWSMYKYNLVKDKRLSILSQPGRAKYNYIIALNIAWCLVYFKYKYFSKFLYNQYYSKDIISDKEYIEMYEEVIVVKKLNKTSNFS